MRKSVRMYTAPYDGVNDRDTFFVCFAIRPPVNFNEFI